MLHRGEYYLPFEMEYEIYDVISVQRNLIESISYHERIRFYLIKHVRSLNLIKTLVMTRYS
jgi:hypothetical protein